MSYLFADDYSDTTTSTVLSDYSTVLSEDSTVQSEDTTTNTVKTGNTITSTVQSGDTTTSTVQSEDKDITEEGISMVIVYNTISIYNSLTTIC